VFQLSKLQHFDQRTYHYNSDCVVDFYFKISEELNDNSGQPDVMTETYRHRKISIVSSCYDTVIIGLSRNIRVGFGQNPELLAMSTVETG